MVDQTIFLDLQLSCSCPAPITKAVTWKTSVNTFCYSLFFTDISAMVEYFKCHDVAHSPLAKGAPWLQTMSVLFDGNTNRIQL